MADFTDAKWRKATLSGNNNNCVEVAFVADAVGVRDSKDPAKESHIFARSEWEAFLGGVRKGEFDLP